VLGNLRGVTLPDSRAVEYKVDAHNRRIGERVNGVRQWGLLYQNAACSGGAGRCAQRNRLAAVVLRQTGALEVDTHGNVYFALEGGNRYTLP
jgi:YD repeat-containing protein